MRYWLLSGRARTGPYEIPALIRARGFAPQSLICPEDKAVRLRRNWKTARRFKDVALHLGSLKPPSPPPEPPPTLTASAVPTTGAVPSGRDANQPSLSGPAFMAALLAAAFAAYFVLDSVGPTPQDSVREVRRRSALDRGQRLEDSAQAQAHAALRHAVLPHTGKSLAAEMGPGAAWTMRRLISGRIRVEVRGEASHPLTGERYLVRLLYDPRNGTVQAANPLAEFLMESPEPIPVRAPDMAEETP